ncbi:MAG: polysaccharide biosynthesis protein [Promethearchaeota archaeon]
MWSRIGFSSLKRIILANFIATALIGLSALTVVHNFAIPRSVLIIDLFICLSIIGGTRFAYRTCVELLGRKSVSKEKKNVLIIGAGMIGESLVREILADYESTYKPVAFLDDEKSKKGKMVQDVPVLGKIELLPEVVYDKGISLIIIAIASLVGDKLKRVVNLCESVRLKYGTKYRILPGNKAIIEEHVSISQIRKVKAEDLLRRMPFEIDKKTIEKHFFGKTIVVTGAAGSIGSELVRQVYNYFPMRMILIDKAESQLFYLQQELSLKKNNVDMQYFIGDLCNYKKMEEIFKRFKPDVVLHAAAYKHVPLMEINPEEAIHNNVVSTRNMVKLSNKYRLKNFILVSTDKAVRPTNVMGASKRIAELVVQSYNGSSPTIFTTVRFGNVIGSDGSLVPLLSKQIEKGGPVTITHKDIERYFMTIPEAVRLITQAMIMGKGNDVFVLDMGKPIKINDLAEDLIRLSGYKPHEQIKLMYTGLRPGEKMYEELWNGNEKIVETGHSGIKKAIQPQENIAEIETKVEDLLSVAETFRRKDIVKKIRALVPEADISEEIYN